MRPHNDIPQILWIHRSRGSKIEYPQPSQLEIKEQILQELKDAITSGQLDDIITLINSLTVDVDGSIAKVENTIQRLFRGITKDTNKIRECAAKLVSEHIEKIRTQLISKLGN